MIGNVVACYVGIGLITFFLVGGMTGSGIVGWGAAVAWPVFLIRAIARGIVAAWVEL